MWFPIHGNYVSPNVIGCLLHSKTLCELWLVYETLVVFGRIWRLYGSKSSKSTFHLWGSGDPSVMVSGQWIQRYQDLKVKYMVYIGFTPGRRFVYLCHTWVYLYHMQFAIWHMCLYLLWLNCKSHVPLAYIKCWIKGLYSIVLTHFCS